MRMTTLNRVLCSQPRWFSSGAPAIQRVGVVGLGLMGHGIAQVQNMTLPSLSAAAQTSPSLPLLSDRGREGVRSDRSRVRG